MADRDRATFVAGVDLDPASLVGSWFHRLVDGDMVWQGVVVGEPQPGVYLVQIDRLDIGAERVQRLIPIQRMAADDHDGEEWRFYDDDERARIAFAAWVATERERTT